MNETRENTTMQRVAELMDMHELKEQARRSVANDVLVFLDPENCREMALGVADVLQNADMDGWTTDAVNRTGQAIAMLLRVSDLQEQAESEAKMKVWHQERDAEKAKAVKSTIEWDGEPVELESELVALLRETVRNLENTLVPARGVLNKIEAQREETK